MSKSLLLLFLILALAIFLRVFNVPSTLLFHFDQGYHGLAIKEIWENKRLALLGHKTDVEGIFHGSTFYYLMLPLYLFSSWDPAGVSKILAFFDGFAIVFIFLIGRELFNKKVGFLAALFYAVSYSLVSYSRWLSNITLIPFFSTAFFYFLLKSSKNSLRYFPLACFILGFISQLNGAISFFFLPLMAVFFYFLRKKLLTKKKYLAFSIFSFLLPSSPLILFDLRHNFLVSRSILKLFFQGQGFGFDAGKLISNFGLWQNEFISLLSYKIPVLAYILLFLAIAGVVHCRLVRESSFKMVKIISLFLVASTLSLWFYPKGIHQFFYIGTLPLLILMISWALVYWNEKQLLKPLVWFLVLTIVGLNLYYWRGFLKPGFNLIPIGTRNLITLEDRIRAVDFMYQGAEKTFFRTIIYIIPYFQEQPWDYVFSWYGKSKYGYLPNSQAEKTFVIYEPDYDFPYRLESWLGKIEKDHGRVLANFKAHDLTVELREK